MLHAADIEMRLLLEAVYAKYSHDFRDYSGADFRFGLYVDAAHDLRTTSVAVRVVLELEVPMTAHVTNLDTLVHAWLLYSLIAMNVVMPMRAAGMTANQRGTPSILRANAHAAVMKHKIDARLTPGSYTGGR